MANSESEFDLNIKLVGTQRLFKTASKLRSKSSETRKALSVDQNAGIDDYLKG